MNRTLKTTLKLRVKDLEHSYTDLLDESLPIVPLAPVFLLQAIWQML